MKRVFIWMLFGICAIVGTAEGQIQPYITYDSLSGDYIVGYQGSQGVIEVYFVPATKIDPSVRSTVGNGDTLRYHYDVTNGASSQQRLLNFRLSLRSPVLNVTRPSTQWRSRSDNLVSGWYWGHTLVNADGGPSLDMGIPPDSTITGFSFQSFGLPSIVNSYLQGLTGIMSFEEEPPDGVHELLRPLETFPANEVLRRAIGPSTPPTPFNGLTFLDTIKSYINQSRTLGWITNQTTANKYLGFIDSARSNLQANNRGITKANLDLVLVNVNVDSASSLTSEAYALLQFNTEYVLKKLREEDSTFAAQNKSSSWNATATNNARHLTKTENHLHEVFTTGGEIYYRRSGDGGSTWDQTHRLNTPVGDNSRPSIVTAATSSLHIVWQRKIAASRYEVWHSWSENNGVTWSTAAKLPNANDVEVSGYQTEGTMPVIADWNVGFLVVVYCSGEGLRYRISEDDGENWQIPDQDIIGGKGVAQGDQVRFPSLSSREKNLYVLYDYVDDEYSPYSRTFDGSNWSNETSVGSETGTTFGAFPAVGIDVDNNPIATWSADHTWSRSIVFRAGYTDNTWSSWFEEFWGGQLSPDWVNPSLTYYNGEGDQYSVAIVHHTLGDVTKLIRYTENDWVISTLSGPATWAAITQESSSSGNPIYCWTDQYAFPYEVVIGSSGFSPRLRGGKILNWTQKRRAVVYHSTLHATFSLEFEPMKISTASGDTTLVRFKPASLREQGINLLNMWDYLGSGIVSLPANARRLIVSKQFAQRGPSIAQRKFYLRVHDSNGVPIGVLDSTSTSGTVSVNIAPYAGMNIILRPQVVFVGIIPSSVKIGVGGVYIAPDTQSKPVKQKKK